MIYPTSVTTVNTAFRVLRAAILWVVLILLAAFVLFIEFVADVGGGEEAVQKPPPAQASATPSIGDTDQIQPPITVAP
jgi:hypothetical protein